MRSPALARWRRSSRATLRLQPQPPACCTRSAIPVVQSPGSLRIASSSSLRRDLASGMDDLRAGVDLPEADQAVEGPCLRGAADRAAAPAGTDEVTAVAVDDQGVSSGR